MHAMRYLVPLTVLACAGVPAQAPSEHLAMVNGKPVSPAELQTLLAQAPAALRPQLGANPEKLLQYYGFVQRMAELGEAARLYDQSPYKEQLALARTMVLAQAQMQEYHPDVPPSAEHEYYEAHQGSFGVAKVKAIFIPGVDDAEAKAGEVWKQLTSGADFAAIAKQYPMDMDTIAKSDAATPADVRATVFALKPGEISRPLKQPNGFYLFRLESLSVKPYSEVRGEINRTLGDQRYSDWMAAVQKSVTVVK